MRITILMLASLAAAGCSGEPPSNAVELIERRGAPALFQLECTRHAWDAGTRRWVPQGGFVQVDHWLYREGGGGRGYVLVNGEVVDEVRTTRDLSKARPAGFNPRKVGCGEARAGVERATGTAPAGTTRGTAADATFRFGQVQVEVDYHVLDGQAGVAATYANGKLVGMMSL